MIDWEGTGFVGTAVNRLRRVIFVGTLGRKGDAATGGLYIHHAKGKPIDQRGLEFRRRVRRDAALKTAQTFDRKAKKGSVFAQWLSRLPSVGRSSRVRD